ncbi:hypothetical protein [Drosophila suzukii associated ambidensovirus 1]|nr:hypothetical protein [Drosophila suzukii associated ambidensovirus 1]
MEKSPTFGQLLEEIWENLPDEVASHPGVWWKILEESPMEPSKKEKLRRLLITWSKNYNQWSIGSFVALKKKLGKTVDSTFLMYMPANQSNELLEWLSDWKNEQNLSDEVLSASLSTAIMSTPSTAAHSQAGRANATSRTSQKRKRTFDDFFDDLAPSKRSNEETGKISQNIFARKGDEQRSLKCTVPYKEYLLKLQLYPTLSYQAKMKEDHTQAWRTALIRCNLTVDLQDSIMTKVQEIVESGKKEIQSLLEENEESMEPLE